MYEVVTNESLPKVQALGDMLYKFRQIRIPIRSLGFRNLTAKESEMFTNETKEAIGAFDKAKEHFTSLLTHEKEKELAISLEKGVEAFYQFGGQLLSLAAKGDDASYNEIAELVKYTCPKKTEQVENVLKEFISFEEALSVQIVKDATEKNKATLNIVLITVFSIVVLSISIGFFFSLKLSSKLTEAIQTLSKRTKLIDTYSNDILNISMKITESSLQQSSSLQETVASAEEISGMVNRNADNAHESEMTSTSSLKNATDGKLKAEQMLRSIDLLNEGNRTISNEIKKSNDQVSQIINVIQSISQKTEVINEIVFQTKLLSFNASVEAARAGEHGKGFAVVAEEVGNLANHSGKAANEISQMLSESINKVTQIIDSSKLSMERLINENHDKMKQGSFHAKECEEALKMIHTNTTKVNDLVREISSATKEQAKGVSEISSAINEMDTVVKENSMTALDSKKISQELQEQAGDLKNLVHDLNLIVLGKSDQINEVVDYEESHQDSPQTIKQAA